MIMATYRTWLSGQIGRQDIVGELAAAVHGNVNKPRQHGVDGIERWIRTVSGFDLDWGLKAHAAAVAAYNAEQGHVQTKVIKGAPVTPSEGSPLASVHPLHGRKTEPAVITNRELLGRVSEQLDAILANQMAIMDKLGVEPPVPDFGYLAAIAVYEDEQPADQGEPAGEPEPAAGGEPSE